MLTYFKIGIDHASHLVLHNNMACTPDNFDIFFGHIVFVILDILKIFCSNKHQIITDLLNYLDPIKS
jgi:hypothetical protein